MASLCFAGDTLSDYSEFGTNSNTLKKDDRAWDFWETVCERAGTSPMRTPQEVRENPERQAWLLAILMLYIRVGRLRVQDPGTGMHQTALGACVPLGHIIRIFNRWGTPMPRPETSRAHALLHGARHEQHPGRRLR